MQHCPFLICLQSICWCREDLEQLPPEADLDAYAAMPVEQFGMALLRCEPAGCNVSFVAGRLVYGSHASGAVWHGTAEVHPCCCGSV